MRFLNYERVIQNTALLYSHVLKESSSGNLHHKIAFIEALNKIQGTSFSNTLESKVEFDNTEIVNFLLRNGVFQEKDVEFNSHIIPISDRPQIEATIKEALSLINSANPNLYNLLHAVVGTIAIHSIAERDGGSISNAIGLIWLSPLKEWSSSYYGEMIVHELIHNCVFLEDMVRGIMPNTDLLANEDALTISAIRQTKRPYDKAFHSACVVTGIMYYYSQLGESEKALQFLPSLRNTLVDLRHSYNKMAAKDQLVLSQNGYEILNELDSFSKELEYSVFEKSLALS